MLSGMGEGTPQSDRDAAAQKAGFDAILALRTLEYGTLRTEILARSNAKSQQFTVVVAVSALLAGLASGETVSAWGFVLAAGVSLLGLASWFDASRSIGRLSRRLALIECEINTLMAVYGAGDVLHWEIPQQQRGWFKRLVFGKPADTRTEHAASARA
jgi:hypothetical protein